MRWICVVILFIQGCNAVAPVRPIESKDDKKQVDIKVDKSFDAAEFSAELARQAELANSDPAFKASALIDGILNQGVKIGVPEDYCKRVRLACPAVGKKPASDLTPEEVKLIKDAR